MKNFIRSSVIVGALVLVSSSAMASVSQKDLARPPRMTVASVSQKDLARPPRMTVASVSQKDLARPPRVIAA
jgi:hypothetical protein